mgnify:CR=1 FL=1
MRTTRKKVVIHDSEDESASNEQQNTANTGNEGSNIEASKKSKEEIERERVARLTQETIDEEKLMYIFNQPTMRHVSFEEWFKGYDYYPRKGVPSGFEVIHDFKKLRGKTRFVDYRNNKIKEYKLSLIHI